MSRFFFAFFLLVAPFAWSQVRISPFDLPPNVRQYLELTEAQAGSINELNRAYNTFISSKLQRQFTVQSEIFTETAKQTLDPMALGLRYLELEAIQREIRAEQTKTVTAVQNVLTAAQKTRLTTLQEVLRLQSTACTAINANLLAQPTVFPGNIIPSIPISIPSIPIVGTYPVSLLSGCATISTGNRTGDFAFNPNPPAQP